jgi:hypothetical protein
MTHAQRMIEANPSPAQVDAPTLAECIEACFDCAQTCTACADACLGEQHLNHLACCVRLDLDCADLCGAAGRVLSRQTAFEPEMVRAVLLACTQSCRACGYECEQHARDMNMEHCRLCAEACRRCEAACNNLLSAMGS